MGCVVSRLEEEEEVVSICRERKRLMKLAVERRYALADAHCRYCHSLCGVSAAIKLFVARHSSPCSPLFITLPPPDPDHDQTSPPPPAVETVITNPMFLQQNPSPPTTTTQEVLPSSCEFAVSCCSPATSSSQDNNGHGEETEERNGGGHGHEYQQQRHQQPGGYFYMGMPMPMASPQSDYGWDFFNPLPGFARMSSVPMGFGTTPTRS